MKRRKFFTNLGSIIWLAVAGTIISAFVTAACLWGLGKLQGFFEITFTEALSFGALISATDPVTVLAIFQRLGAEINLYSVVFGESVLNDAVAIVLFETVVRYLSVPFTGHSLGHAVGDFMRVCLLLRFITDSPDLLRLYWCWRVFRHRRLSCVQVLRLHRALVSHVHGGRHGSGVPVHGMASC